LLRHWAADHERAFADFMSYKVRVPVCGTILLNESLTKVLLVRGYSILIRWKATAGWGFPKGKINQTENEISCAIREVFKVNQVFEETGFDVSMYIKPEDYVERMIKDQRIRLFILSIEEQTEFETQTRKEIGDIQWHSINSLPGYKDRKNSDNDVYTNNKKFKYYMVTPFVPALRKWIQKTKKLRNEGKERRSAALKVIMDTVEGEDSDTDESEDIQPEVVHSQVYLEKSLKNLLGITEQYSSEQIAEYAPDYSEQDEKNSLLDILFKKEKESLMDILLKPKAPVLQRTSSEDNREAITTKSESVQGRNEKSKKSPNRKQKQKQAEQTDNLLKLLIKVDSVDSGLNERLSGTVNKSRKSLMDILEGVPMPPGPTTVFGKSVASPNGIDSKILPSPQVKSNKKVQEENELLELLVSPKVQTKKPHKGAEEVELLELLVSPKVTPKVFKGSDELLGLLVGPKVTPKEEKIFKESDELLGLLVGPKMKLKKERVVKEPNELLELLVSPKSQSKKTDHSSASPKKPYASFKKVSKSKKEEIESANNRDLLVNPKKPFKEKIAEDTNELLELLISPYLGETPKEYLKPNGSDELLGLLLSPKEKQNMSEPQGLGLGISNAGGLMGVLKVNSPQVVTSGQKKEKEKDNGLLALLLGK
jgi:8-oxo-dGTP pyrophosphatase MutT (NUDIX family)